MSFEDIQSILNGNHVSNKLKGHGIGLLSLKINLLIIKVRY